jgi:hypothetical protein
LAELNLQPWMARAATARSAAMENLRRWFIGIVIGIWGC